MPDKDASTPRVFLVRHGETAWTQSGRYTGRTDIPLTPHGIAQVTSTASVLVGPGKLISPRNLAKIYISPRSRATVTADLLFGPKEGGGRGGEEVGGVKAVTEELAEWDYGIYEGLLTGEIRKGRKGRGLDGERGWDIWLDGCEGGESPAQVTARLDSLIAKIRDIQRPCMHGEGVADVVLVAHGHILRAFTKRWLGYPMEFLLSMMLEPGGVGILSYQHHSIDEPAFMLGLGIPVTERVVK